MPLAFFMMVKRTGREAHRSTSSTKVSHTSIWLHSVSLNWAQRKLFRLLSLLENKESRFLRSCGRLGFLISSFELLDIILMKFGVVMELIPASYFLVSYSLRLIFEFVWTDHSGSSGNTRDLYLRANRFEYHPVHRLRCWLGFCVFPQPPADKRWYGATVCVKPPPKPLWFWTIKPFNAVWS